MENADHLRRGNLLWESSRMFLPEHKEQLLAERRRQRDYTMPELEEDRLAELDAALGESWRSGRAVVVTYAEPTGPMRVHGHIARLDALARTLRIDTADGHVSLKLAQLLDVRLAKHAPQSDQM